MRSIDPDWWVTPNVQLLRDTADYLRWLQWAKSADAAHGVPPKRTLLTAAERRAATPAEFRFDVVPLDQFDEVLAARQRAAS
jgi:hypothetical protein